MIKPAVRKRRRLFLLSFAMAGPRRASRGREQDLAIQYFPGCWGFLDGRIKSAHGGRRFYCPGAAALAGGMVTVTVFWPEPLVVKLALPVRAPIEAATL